MIDQHYLSASCCPIAFAKHSGSPDLLGGIPATWLFAAARPPGRSLQVGIALWYEAGRHESHIVPLGNIAAHAFGLDRNAKYRALAWLERAGLVKVERKLGRSPIVTLLSTPGMR